jgi:hypothetical protein
VFCMSQEKKQCGCGNSAPEKMNQVQETGGESSVNSIRETECGCTSGKSTEVKNRSGKLQVTPASNIYRERRPVIGEVVTVIDVTFGSSVIDLAESWSRAVIRNDVHEIMLWSPLEEGDDAAAVAFIEITQGGNIVNGDEVRLDGEAIGSLAGFDYNHMPNHMNIVVETNSLEIPLTLGSIIEFIPNPMLPLLDENCC